MQAAGAPSDDEIVEVNQKMVRLGEREQRELYDGLAQFEQLRDAWFFYMRHASNIRYANRMCVPAMLVAATMGRAYETVDDQKNFVNRNVKVLGAQGVDWDFCPKGVVFGGAFEEYSNKVTHDLLEFPVPGGGGTKITWRSDCGPNTKFPCVTPFFATKLLLKCQSPRRDQFIDLFIRASMVLQQILDGQRRVPQAAAPTQPAFVGPVTWQEQLEYQRGMAEIELIRRRNEEMARVNTREWKQMMESTLTADDDRERLIVRDLVFNSCSMAQANAARAPGVVVPMALTASSDELPTATAAGAGAGVHSMGGDDPFISHIDTASTHIGRNLTRMGEAANFGRLLVTRYRAERGRAPPKSRQDVRGRVCNVNQYRQSDTPLIQAVADEFLATLQ